MVSPVGRSEEGRLPPHDFDAEEAVLGSLLIDEETVLKVVPVLTAQDFYRDKNRWVYEACLKLYDQGQPINQVTVAHEMGQAARLEESGGAAYLGHLISQVPTSVHAEYYAQIVRRASLMRRLIGAAREIEDLGYDADHDVDATLARAEELLFRLRRGEGSGDFVHISEVLSQYFHELVPQAREEEGPVPHLRYGFAAMDELLGGLQRSDMVVLAARPSLGKSTLAMNIARNVAMQQGAHVAVFSLEMSGQQLVHRLLASEAGVDSRKIRLGNLTDREESLIIDATGILSEAAIYLDDSPVLDVHQMRSKARRLHLDRRVDMVIVDYLQLLSGGRRSENRVQEISEISRGLKALARELEVPVLALSQLSRAVEQRPDHRPILSDLRESGSIEQDADVVFFLYRDDVYYTQEQWEQRNPAQPYPRGITDIIVAKHRHGPTDTVQLHFDGRVARFQDMPEGPP